MTTEEDFQKALDANPDDHNTRLVFADFLQEHGDPRAEGYRVLGTTQRSPRGGNFNFYGPESNKEFGAWVEPFHKNLLPQDWFDLVKGPASSPMPKTWQYGYNRRDIEDAAALAFSKLPHERRAQLLGQQSEASPEQLTRRRLARRRYKLR